MLELHPRIDTDEGPFTLAVAAGHERKTTGSYYTPTSLINCLLDLALDPVVAEALNKPDPEKALLHLKICDPACGSGHFLIVAAERMAKHLARLRTGDDEPSLSAIQHAKRDIIGRCIYGVDLNPMAAELCKVSLWMEALEPGRPLSFLDHHIQVGNSLLGATLALIKRGIPDEAFEPIEGDDKAVCRDYRKQNRDERNRQTTMFDLFAKSETIRLSNIGSAMARIESIIDDSIEAIHAKDEAYRELKKSQPYEFAKLLADAWCAAFVIPKVRVPDLQPRVTLTESTLRKLENNANVVPRGVKDEITRLADRYQFFHWHLAFLNVFHPVRAEDIADDDILGWKGGFDVVLGNPPWERIKIQEQEWFAQRRPEIAKAPNAAARRKMIQQLAVGAPSCSRSFRLTDGSLKARATSSGTRTGFHYADEETSTYIHSSAELDRQLMRSTGRVGMVLPPGIVYDDTTKHFFRDLMERGSLVSFFHFENEEFLFPAVDHRVVFSLMTLTGTQRLHSETDFAFFARHVEQLNERDRHFTLTAEEIRLMNPNTGTCPIFRSKLDAKINKAIYQRAPVLIQEGSPERNPWGIRFMAMLHMANDSGLFRTEEQLEADGWTLEGNRFRRGDRTYLPLYEAKMVHHFDHRFGTYEGQTDSQANQSKLPEMDEAQHSDPNRVSLPWYWVPSEEVQARLNGRWDQGWLIGWRDVCRNTDTRTVIVSLIPLYGVGHKFPIMIPAVSGSQARVACLYANLASFVLED